MTTKEKVRTTAKSTARGFLQLGAGLPPIALEAPKPLPTYEEVSQAYYKALGGIPEGQYDFVELTVPIAKGQKVALAVKVDSEFFYTIPHTGPVRKMYAGCGEYATHYVVVK